MGAIFRKDDKKVRTLQKLELLRITQRGAWSLEPGEWQDMNKRERKKEKKRNGKIQRFATE